MNRLPCCLLLTWALGCRADVESVGDTLIETEGQGGSGGDTTGDASASEAGDSTSADDCDAQLGPVFAAVVDAIARFEASLVVIGDDVEMVRSAQAARLGLPADATAEVVAAEITAELAAYTSGSHQLAVDAIHCRGSIPSARESLAICVPEVEVSSVLFDCADACLVDAAADCSEPVTCRGEAASCEGTCTGTCVIEAAAACDGLCNGNCSAACDCGTAEGECTGVCAGMCEGTCEIVAASCAGTCLGECERMSLACEGRALWCNADGAYCSHDCDSAATAVDVDVTCSLIAALASTASMTCDSPAAQLVYSTSAELDARTCSAFTITRDALALSGARLARDLHHLDAIGTTVPIVPDALGEVQSSLTPLQLVCALPEIDAAMARFEVAVDDFNRIAADATAMHEVIAF